MEFFFLYMNGVIGLVLQIFCYFECFGYEVYVIVFFVFGVFGQVFGVWIEVIFSFLFFGYCYVWVGILSFFCIVVFLCWFDLDVVYFVLLFVLGWCGVLVVDFFFVVFVVVYQIDVVVYIECYWIVVIIGLVQIYIVWLYWWVIFILVLFVELVGQLVEFGVDWVRCWGRGVDVECFYLLYCFFLFCVGWGVEFVVGYVGRFVFEKQVEDLVVL